MPTPIGEILLISDGEALCALEFEDCGSRMERMLRRQFRTYELVPSGSADTRRRIAAYFEGDLTTLDDIPVQAGGSDFQRRVWSALRRIPAGTTTTYGRLAAAIGAPTAPRAVGLANGANPVSVVVPCHRVIGASGDLTGYGGGLARKTWLLRHEREAVARR
ncbi:MAG: methylated-DNA--[protein]-cysteine S-methyltransferase [Streptosporangiaceae bacterium]